MPGQSRASSKHSVSGRHHSFIFHSGISLGPQGSPHSLTLMSVGCSEPFRALQGTPAKSTFLLRSRRVPLWNWNRHACAEVCGRGTPRRHLSFMWDPGGLKIKPWLAGFLITEFHFH